MSRYPFTFCSTKCGVFSFFLFFFFIKEKRPKRKAIKLSWCLVFDVFALKEQEVKTSKTTAKTLSIRLRFAFFFLKEKRKQSKKQNKDCVYILCLHFMKQKRQPPFYMEKGLKNLIFMLFKRISQLF